MIFVDHARQKGELTKTFRQLEKLLAEKQEVFDRTQPGSGGSEVKTSPRNDKYDAYLIATEIIDRRIDDTWENIGQWEKLLEKTEQALAASKDVLDRVYYLSEVRGCTIGQVSKSLNYTERQVRRFWRRISLEMSDNVR